MKGLSQSIQREAILNQRDLAHRRVRNDERTPMLDARLFSWCLLRPSTEVSRRLFALQLQQSTCAQERTSTPTRYGNF